MTTSIPQSDHFDDRPSRWTIPRVLAGLLAVVPTAFFALSVRARIETGWGELLYVIFAAFVGAVAAVLWWFALCGHRRRGRARILLALLCGVVLGAIGFVGGFLGPILMTPEANQGSLLGIFGTGPLGFVAGVLIGVVLGFTPVLRRVYST